MTSQSFRCTVMEYNREDGIAAMNRFLKENAESPDVNKHRILRDSLLAGNPTGVLTMLNTDLLHVVIVVIADDPLVRSRIVEQEKKQLGNEKSTIH